MAKSIVNSAASTNEDLKVIERLILEADLTQAKAKYTLGKTMEPSSENLVLKSRQSPIGNKEQMKNGLNDSSPDEQI